MIFITDDSEATTDLCHGPDFEDDQEQKVHRELVDSLRESSETPSNSQEKHMLLFSSKPHRNENILTGSGNINFSTFSTFSKDKPKVVSCTQSLPRMYKMTMNPSLDEEGEAWRYVHAYVNCYQFLCYYTCVHTYVLGWAVSWYFSNTTILESDDMYRIRKILARN